MGAMHSFCTLDKLLDLNLCQHFLNSIFLLELFQAMLRKCIYYSEEREKVVLCTKGREG